MQQREEGDAAKGRTRLEMGHKGRWPCLLSWPPKTAEREAKTAHCPSSAKDDTGMGYTHTEPLMSNKGGAREGHRNPCIFID